MPGTKAGALKAAATNKSKHGEDFYHKIGAKGGATPTALPKGFAANPALASVAGAKGGRISKRKKREVIDDTI